MNRISVNLDQNSYDVVVGKNAAKNLFKEIENKNFYKNVFFVIDANVNKNHPGVINKLLGRKNIKSREMILRLNESTKAYPSIEKIHSALLKNGYGRDTLLVSIGGGIIGDVAGFAAATFTRGIQYINIPTTLLAAVDSSVGGKTGINFLGTKNIIGAFHQPKLVLIDTKFLYTLPQDEIICGLGEIVKYAFLTEEKFYTYVLKNIKEDFSLKETNLLRFITESVQYKSDVVSKDEKESGLRKLLNLGHTFAHTIEVDQKHKIKHGQAVIAGLNCMLNLSLQLSLLTRERFNRYSLLINKFAGKIKIKKYDAANMYKIMLKDKKNRDGKIKFVLMKRVGEILIDIEADKKEIINAIHNGLKTFC
ncbi:MAG: 3-dehydroquinate synthase [Ignavibacteria bacterium]|jgi:3-dehydroquinate synthase